MTFKISVILATRERPAALAKCMASLKIQRHVVEVLVMDDRGPDPRGCCATRNEGALQATRLATHLYFTDDDCILELGCLEKLCNVGLWTRKSTAATGGSCINMSAPHFAGKIWRYLVDPMTISSTGDIVDLSEFWVTTDQWHRADHLRGGNILVSKRAFKKVGGFSEEYGPGSLRGETDFCLRLRQAGYNLFFNPVARVLHFKTKRQLTAVEKRYDELWRRTWAPKKYLGIDRPRGLAPVLPVGLRQ